MAKEISDSLSIETRRVANWYGDGSSDRKFEVLDCSLLTEWHASVLSLIDRILGESHPTRESFRSAYSPNTQSHQDFRRLESLFRSAKNDFEGGYLFDVANLVHADVFADELEQAKHFLDNNFKVAAAVIAGTVLETTLRRMCDTHPELSPSDNINGMNTDLYTGGVYGKAVNKQVGSWGDIRNDAAHGRPDEFDHQQVNQMITGIRDFVAKHMS
ncbi:DUF4145 domain-containing protein [Crateriforma conspicua]|uniref:DUF4145 domain-containing protein n=1 Tax=Crateriforma conspicua TaxID=2527996 RepID=UPI0011AA426C|nr:DUF4145 domain-containing protein [Crateriforma conspicua]